MKVSSLVSEFMPIFNDIYSFISKISHPVVKVIKKVFFFITKTLAK